MMKTGIELIAKERQEQIEKHFRTILKDVEFNNHYQLSQAASLLLWVDEEDFGNDTNACCPSGWDENIWAYMMNKPYKERVIIAGALCAAEYDRIDAIDQNLPELERLAE